MKTRVLTIRLTNSPGSVFTAWCLNLEEKSPIAMWIFRILACRVIIINSFGNIKVW